MIFEWDDKKASANVEKHGLSFDNAIRIFTDNKRKMVVDDRFDYGEERLIAIGHIDGRLSVVIYTKEENVIRIISARKANKREQKIMTIIRKNVDFNNLSEMSEKDLARFDAIADEEINYSDIPELDEDFFKRALSASEFEKDKTRVTIRLDSDVVAWLKRKGRGYQTRANMILRAAMEHQSQS